MTDPATVPSTKRTSKPSAKLIDTDNGEEPELRSHKAARDRAIAAEEAGKVSHDLTAVSAPPKAVHAHALTTSTSTSTVSPGASQASRKPSNSSNLSIPADAATTSVAAQSKRASVADADDTDDEDTPGKVTWFDSAYALY